jgi:hypothetical protein
MRACCERLEGNKLARRCCVNIVEESLFDMVGKTLSDFWFCISQEVLALYVELSSEHNGLTLPSHWRLLLGQCMVSSASAAKVPCQNSSHGWLVCLLVFCFNRQ